MQEEAPMCDLQESMIRKLCPLFFGLCLALSAREQVQLVTTEHFDLAAGGLVRVMDSTGELNIEGWDRPDVEVTVTRLNEADPGKKDQVTRELKRIEVTTKRQSDGELVITTKKPARSGLNIALDYRIRVPMGTRLAIRHKTGDVVIFNVGGDIDASAKLGGIVVQLPVPASYAIDAKKGIGTLYNDFAGEPTAKDGTPHKIHLHVSIGGIEIQKVTTEAALNAEGPMKVQ